MSKERQLQKNPQIRVIQDDDNQEEIDKEKQINTYQEVKLSRRRLICALLCGILLLIFGGVTLLVNDHQDRMNIVIKDLVGAVDNPIVVEHDRKCYTQGLSFINKTHILQSCGLYGKSYFHILQYSLKKGQSNILKQVYKSATFDPVIFLEGSIYFPKNQLFYFLTWREHAVIRYEQKEGVFVEKDRLDWKSQGWGLTHNGSHLFVSDGSNKIYVTTPEMEILETLAVTHLQSKLSIHYINELQWVQEAGTQYIYANVYQSDSIVKIDSKTGTAVKQLNLEPLVLRQPQAIRGDEVLNGIAYDIEGNKWILTGKKWKSIYIVDSL